VIVMTYTSYRVVFVMTYRVEQKPSPRVFVMIATSVARLGEKVPIGLLLTAIGTRKFGFGALIATF